MRRLDGVCCGALLLCALTLSACSGGSSTPPAPGGSSAALVPTGPPPSPGGGADTIGGRVSTEVGRQPTITVPSTAPPARLLTKDIVAGRGAVAGESSTVTTHFVGVHWTTGKPFYSSWAKPGGQPDTYSLQSVIRGFREGVSGMRVGGRREIVVPPALGYGDKGSGQVGPGETLVFVVDLVAVA